MAHILVIDDEADLRDIMRLALEQMGHRVTLADDGNVGVARFKADPADLVITDLLMPEQEGVETIMQLRKSQPKLRIIAMSGGGPRAEIYLQICARLGTRTLAKPFTMEDLHALVTQAMAADP